MKTSTRNKKFLAASKAEKRVMIAKDVLAQLAAKRFKPKTGAFARMNFRKLPDPDTQITDIIGDDASRVVCQACALGAMMLSEIRHTNALKVGSVIEDGNSIYIERGAEGDRLDKYFSEAQLRLIEIAFERGKGYYSEHWFAGKTVIFTEKEQLAMELFTDLTPPAKRMRIIMENIVANGGKFVV